MAYTDRQQREVFHLLFLERLLKIADPRLFVLKGGVNLRFFFNSPRYSEDMDLDVLGGSVATLTKNGYRILEDPAFARSLAAFGITDLIVDDPSKAKQSSTTQRFRARVVTSAGEIYPTKVEFSRRRIEHEFAMQTISPAIALPYRRLAFACQHYTATAAVQQKVAALAHITAVQSRDVFDLYMLWLGGHLDTRVTSTLAAADRSRAMLNLLALDYADYKGQVLDYLEPEHVERFSGEPIWNEMCETVRGVLESTHTS